MTPATTVPRQWVWAAAAALALTAVGSLVLGAARGGPGRDAVSDIGALAPVPDAAQAKPITDLTAEDARFRQIAREEAQAALSRSAPAPKPKAAPKAEDDGGDTDATTPAPSPSDAGAIPHAPVTTPKPAVAATSAAAAGQRALLGSSARGSSATTPTTARPSSGLSNPSSPGSSPD